MAGCAFARSHSLLLLVGALGCTETPLSSVGSTAAEEVGEGEATDQGEDDGGLPKAGYASFFIGESTKFDGGGKCDAANLNTVTRTLRNRLDDAGWSGLRFVDDNSWPEDFIEAEIVLGGLDGSYGDAATLAVYAGHGDVGFLSWGRPSDTGLCSLSIPPVARLGRMSGGQAKVAMFLTSCTSRQDQAWEVYRFNAFRHVMGYHNSPYVGPDEARKVFKRMQDGQPSVYAWLDEMEQNGAPGKNSPVAMTMGDSGPEAEAVHPFTNLASGAGFDVDVGEPAGGYYLEWLNNGCTVSCGNCADASGASPGAGLDIELVGERAPLLKMTRPKREASEIHARASAAILALAGALGQHDSERLERWAQDIAATGDVAYIALDAAAIDLSYDPRMDLLRVTNRGALARARPSASAREGALATTGLDIGEAELLAKSVRDQLEPALAGGEPWSEAVAVSTREVASGVGSALNSTPFEYRFSVGRRRGEFEIFGAELRVGVTRLGEPSSILVSEVEVEAVDTLKIERDPTQALAALEATILASEPALSELEFDVARMGYALAEDEDAALVEPSLLVGYVGIVLGSQGDRVVTRRVPLRLSLIDPASVPERLAAADVPDAGDPRDPR
ncbi:hypothetical protein G6O69_02005 [Pseudenhygromyxa sp. WMMC2535]|uniref:DUF6345 domain-containing protein n=1 Tax=Pseudenhygromyxa sp. WMMC2535 TaxID=2712867 RepID=UPI001595B84B|nr:DUF6345 domain-containing protein [Pseudenhygromyxa sp. WMMC2535]NVB36588.1 hypothetical protein [Pseudenhygromyxa sp. WMMC2535]